MNRTMVAVDERLSEGQLGILEHLFRIARHHDKETLKIERNMDSFIKEVPDETRRDLQIAIDDLDGETAELHAALAAAAVTWARHVPEPFASIAADGGELLAGRANEDLAELFEASGIGERFVP